MYDISLLIVSFESTTMTVKWNTEKGKSLFESVFGNGAMSVEIPKSRGEDFAVFCARKGLIIG